MVICFFIPLILMVISYSMIFLKLHESAKRLQKARNQEVRTRLGLGFNKLPQFTHFAIFFVKNPCHHPRTIWIPKKMLENALFLWLLSFWLVLWFVGARFTSKNWSKLSKPHEHLMKMFLSPEWATLNQCAIIELLIRSKPRLIESMGSLLKERGPLV